MQKFLFSSVALVVFAGSAVAADLPSRKAPLTAPAALLWTGFHVGLNAGGTWGNNTSTNISTWNTQTLPTYNERTFIRAAQLTTNSSQALVGSGFIGGGQVGYDWQVNYGSSNFVAGVEADIQGVAGASTNKSRWSGNNILSLAGLVGNDYATFDETALSNQQITGSLNYLGTVRGRVGYLALPNLLIYGTGGLAYGGVNNSLTNYQITNRYSTFNGTVLVNGPQSLAYGNQSQVNTQVGWTAGGGLEWMFLNNWSSKVEYLYYDLGNIAGTTVNTSYSLIGADPSIASISNYSSRVTGNLVRAGLNYHFTISSAPIVAQY